METIVTVTIITVAVPMAHVVNAATNATTMRLIIRHGIPPNQEVVKATMGILIILLVILTIQHQAIATMVIMLALAATGVATNILKAAIAEDSLGATTTAIAMIVLIVREVVTLGTTTAAAITGTPTTTQVPVGIALTIARQVGVVVAVEAAAV